MHHHFRLEPCYARKSTFGCISLACWASRVCAVFGELERVLFSLFLYDLGTHTTPSKNKIKTGDMPWSYRLFDITTSNSIPILITSNYTPPFSHILNWTQFSWYIKSRDFVTNPMQRTLWYFTFVSLKNSSKRFPRNAYNRCFINFNSQLHCLLDAAYGRMFFHLKYCPEAPPFPPISNLKNCNM